MSFTFILYYIYTFYFLGFNEEASLPVTMSGSSMDKDISKFLFVTFVCILSFKIFD